MSVGRQHEISEIVKCGRDPLYFMKRYAKVRTQKHGVVPFKTWPFQDDCVRDFMKNRLNIVNKARQLGLSTVTAVYALWLALFQKDRSILVIATKLPTAINFIKKVKVALQNLPPWLVLPKIKTENKSQLAFSNGSEITAITTSVDAGRSEALSLLIVDEAAWIRNFDDIWTGLYPTLSDGAGCAILMSTPNGVGGQFYKLCSEAKSGHNDFNYIELKWDVRPDHDQEWFARETRGFGRKRIAQEHMCDFLSSGDTFLQADDLEWLRSQQRDPVERLPILGDGSPRDVWVWYRPVPGKQYIISSDVARGDAGEKGDYSTFHVFDPAECKVAAEFMGRIPPDKLADALDSYGKMYNNALLAPELNTFGHHTCTRLRDHHRYPRLYYKNAVGNAFEYRPNNDTEPPGFMTTPATRPVILTKLEELVRNRVLQVHSKRLYDEMHAFIWNGTKAQASKDSHDDLIMSLAIGAWLVDNTFGHSVHAGAVGQKLLECVSVVRRDVGVIPATNIHPLVNPRMGMQIQHSVYRGLHTGPVRGARNDYSWLF